MNIFKVTESGNVSYALANDALELIQLIVRTYNLEHYALYVSVGSNCKFKVTGEPGEYSFIINEIDIDEGPCWID